MPEDKNHWLAFNVQQTKGQNMCQLTAWLNEYYPDAKFPCELFQTWNPHKKPDPEKVLAESHFLRVVHTKDTVSILSDINKAQGRHGFYFAGAYAVEGMGLLEQAAVSAQRVVGLIEQRVEVQSQLAMLHSKEAGKELELIMSDLGKMKSEIDSMMPRYNLLDKTKDKQSIPAAKSVKGKSDSSKTRLKSPVRRSTSMKK
jgi:predicted NAD/FAD-binding protein